MSLSLSLRLSGRLAVIVGGGAVALRKARALSDAGAALRIVAPAIEPALSALVGAGDCRERAYAESDLDDAYVVVAATDEPTVNARVVDDARARRTIVIDAMSGERGDATMPATARMGDVTISVDTAGASPAFAARIAREVRERFGDDYARAARTLAHARTYVKAVVADKAERGAVLRSLAERPLAQLATMNAISIEHEAEETLERMRRGDRPESETHSVVCASRASALAMTQTRFVAAKLALRGIATAIVNVTTTGDRVTDRPLAAIGAESLFIKELEVALRARRADYAVHSCKDLPTLTPPDMRIVAISAREDARDVFCSERFERFDALPSGAVVGTSSLRRRAQLAALRPDLRYEDLRGNVDTRLRKLRDGAYDAIVIAAAGLARLHARATHTVPFDVDDIVPAVAQGALAVETRANDDRLAREVRAAVNDDAAERAVMCERAALRTLQGGCQAPIGIHARVCDGELHATGVVASLDGATIVRARVHAPAENVEQAESLGVQLAERLRAGGADAIVAALPRVAPRPLAGRLVALGRTQDRPSRIADALRAAGADVVELRDGEAPHGPPPDALVFPSSGSVAAAAAYLAALGGARPVVAAMGAASGRAAAEAGWPPDVTAPEATVDALVGALRAHLEATPP